MNVVRKTSPIHGNGVFAQRRIAKGSWQFIYGEVLPLQEHPLDHYCFEHKDGMYLPYAPFCWLNHSETPNCDFEFRNDTLIIWAEKAIKRGEELTIDYGYTP